MPRNAESGKSLSESQRKHRGIFGERGPRKFFVEDSPISAFRIFLVPCRMITMFVHIVRVTTFFSIPSARFNRVRPATVKENGTIEAVGGLLIRDRLFSRTFD